MAVNTTPMKLNTRGGAAIELFKFAFRCQGDPGGRLLTMERGKVGPPAIVATIWVTY